MRGFVFFVFLWSSLSTCLSCAAYHTPHMQRWAYPVAHAADERARAVAVGVICANGKHSLGSGVAVGVVGESSYVLTARHVIACGGVDAPPAHVMIETATGVNLEASVDYVDIAADVARLKVEGVVDAPPVVLARYGPSDDSTVCVSTAVPFRSRLCDVVQREEGAGEVRTSVVVDFGNSGSAVYNNRGELVGVVVRLVRATNGQHVGSIVDTRVTAALASIQQS